MGKRILSFLLAVVMVLGMVPATAIPTFAVEQETSANTYEAYYADSIKVDGTLNETAWLTSGKLSSGQAFDILWDGGNLYFAVVPGSAGEKLTVTVGDTDVVTDAQAGAGGAIEVNVPYTTYGVDTLKNVTLSIGDSTWTGNIIFANRYRLDVVKASDLPSKSTPAPGVLADGSGFDVVMPATTVDISTDANLSRQFAYGSVSVLNKRETDIFFEYDFEATEMPEVTQTGYVGPAMATYAGPSFTVTEADSGIVCGIMNTKNGLVYRHNTITVGADGKAVTTLNTIPLGKYEKDSFRLRVEWMLDDSVVVYVDGVQVGNPIANATSSETALTAASLKSKATIVMNAYRYDHNGKTTEGFYSNHEMAFKVSNMVLGKAIAPAYDNTVYAAYNGGTPSWNTAEGISAQWDKDNLYLSVTADSGDMTIASAKSVTVNTEHDYVAVNGSHWNVTIPLDDLGIYASDYNQAFALTLSGAYTWNGLIRFVSETAEQIKLGGIGQQGIGTASLYTGSQATTGMAHFKVVYPSTYTSDDDTKTPFDRLHTYIGNIASMDTTNENVLDDIHVVEFDFYAETMPEVANLSGRDHILFADGLNLTVQMNKAATYAYTVGITNLADREGLSLAVKTVGETATLFDLGKGLQETFHIRLEYSLKAQTLNVWRDTELVGSVFVDIGKNTIGSAIEKTLMLNYCDFQGQNRAGTTYDFTVTNLTSGTWDDDPYSLTSADMDTLTFDSIKGSNASQNQVMKDLELPVYLDHSIFNGLELVWTSNNNVINPATGAVASVEEDTPVTLTATIKGMQISKSFNLTVPAALTYEAAHADGITIDGAMDEVAWNALGKLSGGQPFDILWDKDYLYVAAVPGNGDTSLTVSVGGRSVTVKSGDAGWGAAAEAKVPCAISNYGEVEGITITMGTSTWYGNVNVIGLERTLNVTTDKLSTVGCSGVTGVNPVASADKNSYTFTLDPRDTQPTANDRVYAYSSGHSVLKNRTGDISIEFDFAATELPLLNNGSGFMGAGVPQWAGPTVAMSDNQLNGVIFGIQNIAGNLKFCIVYEDATIAKAKGVPYYSELALGKLPGDTFHLRVLWKENGNVAVYVDGTLVGELENVTANGAYMDQVWMGTANTLWVNLHRQLRYYASKVEFTISNIKMGNSYGETALDVLDFDAIKGENQSADQILSDLNLPNTVATRHFGNKTVTWTSNSAAISNTGVVTAADVDTTVTLTATSGTASKSFNLNVAANNMKAYFAGNVSASALTAADDVWTFAQWRPLVVKNGDTAPYGYVAALISGGKVYVAVKSEGASSVEATLAGSPVEAAITDDVVILCFDDVQLTGYNQTLTFQVTLTGSNGATAKLWESGTLTVSNQKLVLNAMDVPTNTTTATGRVDVSADGEVVTFPAAGRTNPPINHSEALWLLQNMNLDDVLVNSKNMLLEQTICINKMPVGEKTSLITSAPAQGNGYKITTELLNNRSSTTHRIFTTNIYPDAQNNLWAKVLKHDGTTSEPIALGKTFGQTFKLGLLYGTDNSTTVYVDGAPVAVIENSAYLHNIYTANTILLKYEDPACTSIDMVDFTVSDLTMTHLESGTERKTETLPAIELTKEALLGDVNLSNLSGKLVLPGSAGEYLNIPLDWVWEGDQIIDNDGNVLYNEERDLTATLTLKVGEEEIWTEDVFVPKYEFEGWLDANHKNTEIKAPATLDKPVLDGVFDEVMWAKATELSYIKLRGINGRVYTAWGLGKLYLAVEFAGSTDMVLTFGGNTWDIDLTQSDIDIDGIVTVKVVGNKAELVIDLLAAGVEVTAYGQIAPLQVVLGDADRYAKLTNEETLDLVFSDYESARFVVSGNISKSSGVTASDAHTLVFENDDTLAADGKPARQYAILGSSAVNRDYDIYLEQTIRVDWMQNLQNGQLVNANSAIDYTDGYYFLISDKRTPPEGTNYSTYGILTYANLWNNNGMLTLKVNRGSGGAVEIPLDKGLGDTFTLGYLWTVGDPAVDTDDTVEVYVDGVFKGSVSNVSYEVPNYGQDTYVLNLRCDAKVTVSDVIHTTYMGTTIPTDPSAGLLDGIEFTDLREDLPFVNVVGHFAYKVNWNSTNTAAISNDGKITRHDTEPQNATLVPSVGGKTLDPIEATVAPMRTAEDVLAETISVEAIFGTTVITGTTESVTLPGSFVVGNETVNLTWESSDTNVITAGGQIVAPGVAYLSVYAEGLTNALWSVKVVVPSAVTKLDAVLTDSIELNGELNDDTWFMPVVFRSVVGGNASRAFTMWKSGNLYLAVDCGDAETITIKLGETSKTVTLSELDPETPDANGITGKALNGTVELCIPLHEFGIKLTEYNESCTFNFVLDGTVKLSENDLDLCFSGYADSALDMTKHNVDPGSHLSATVESATQIRFLTEDDTKRSLWGMNSIAEIDANGLMYLQQTLKITSMEATDGLFTSASLAKGYCFWISDAIDTTTTGNATIANLFYKDKVDGLILRVRQAGTLNTDQKDIKLNKYPGDTFTLGYLYNGGTVYVYVDNVLVGVVENALCESVQWVGKDAIVLNSHNLKADITVSDVSLTAMRYEDVTAEITPEAIFGDINLNAVKENLPMSETFTSKNLGDITIAWETSDDSIIESDGTIHPAKVKDTEATVMVYYKGTKLWEQKVVVKCELNAIDAVVSQGTVTVNGNLNEAAYLNWYKFSNLNGTMAAIWMRGNVYFAINADAGSTLNMTINNIPVEVDLDTAQVSVDGTVVPNGAVRNATTGLVEIGIPLELLQIELTDYNQHFPFVATLSKGETTVTLPQDRLNFSGKIAAAEDLSKYAKNGHFSVNGSTITYSGKRTSEAHHFYEVGNDIDHTKVVAISQDYCFTKLPGSGDIFSGTDVNGFMAWFNDGEMVNSTSSGTAVIYSIFADGDALKLRVGISEGAEGTVIPLDRNLGDTFRLGFVWYPDDTLEIYVDGKLVKTVANASSSQSGGGNDAIYYRYIGKQDSSEDVQFTINNVNTVVSKYETSRDELTREAILGRFDPTNVSENLNMVSSFNTPNFDNLPLYWTVEGNGITTSGVISQQDESSQTAVITAYYGSSEADAVEENLLFRVRITIAPKYKADPAAPALIHTAFAPASSMTIDGKITDGGWVMNGWVRDANRTIVGDFGVQWNKSYLYLAVDKKQATSVSMQINGKSFTVGLTNKKLLLDGAEVDGSQVAVSGTMVEIRIPMPKVYAPIINEYGVKMPITVTIGSYSYTGSLMLSGIDWWQTDNQQARAPVSTATAVKFQGGTPNSDVQGASISDRGWHLYDLYSDTSASGIRGYVLFMKSAVYENFNNKAKTTHVEFDFLAKKMPVFENWTDEKIAGSAYACYGFSFSLSDKADDAKKSNVIVGGITRTEEGLQFAVGGDMRYLIPLVKNKETGELYQVGDQFRVGLTWELDDSLLLYINGELCAELPDMARRLKAVGDNSFVANILNTTDERTAENDIDFYISNIAFGSAYSTKRLMQGVTFDSIKGANTDVYNVTSDLSLPQSIVDQQLGIDRAITWTSDSEYLKVVDGVGAVTRPAGGAALVHLTAELQSGETKTFKLYIPGSTSNNNNVLIITEDTDPFHGAGEATSLPVFILDTDNSSIIAKMDAEQQINLVTITNLSESARLNRESLRLFYSDDNATYQEVRDYKLVHEGYNWYLYDFSVTAKYIKVHYTHFDGEHADFINHPGDMIAATWELSLDEPAEGVTVVDAPITTLYDEAVKLDGSYAAEGLRIKQGDELLYHYVDTDGRIVVRIPEKNGGQLHIWNADGIQLDNKENVYEVTYGTRETTLGGGRWVMHLPAGTTFPNGSTLSKDTIFAMGGNTLNASTDNGYTWSKYASLSFDPSLSCGGWGFDSRTGRMFYEGYTNESDELFKKVSNGLTGAYCHTYIIYSDDGGKTWTLADELGHELNDLQSNYNLSYSDIVELKANDGAESDAIDFVVNMGALYNNNQAFCGRVAYSRDGGMNWEFSESLITFGNEFAFEGGISECTILEREDGTLVLYARCQSNGVDNFAQSYSLDHGVTWLTPGMKSSIYTVNTQPLMMTYDFDGYDGKRGTGTPMFTWGGNNVQGGNSYTRNPLNFAISNNEMDTWRNIQNSFAETFMEMYTSEASHYITNASFQQLNDEDLYVAFGRLYHGDSVYMKMTDFTKWFTRTKGAYDSFEHGTVQYEGWTEYVGAAEVDKKTVASSGSYSMKLDPGTVVSRSVPYLQNGTVSLDVLISGNSDFALELQPAFSAQEGKCDTISLKVKGTVMTLTNGQTITLTEGWNTITIELNLTEGKAAVAANGVTKDVPVDLETGDYVCYVVFNTRESVNVDEFFVESDLDAVVGLSEAEKSEADGVIDLIAALPDADAITNADRAEIEAAREAYTELSPAQRDWVNRRVRNNAAQDVHLREQEKIAAYMTNYYDVLVAAEEALEAELAKIDVKISVTLNETVDMNFKMDLAAFQEHYRVVVTKDGEELGEEQYQRGTLVDSNAGGQTKYCIRVPLYADEMCKVVRVQIFDGDKLVADNESSVRNYAQQILDKYPTYTISCRAVIALVDYGSAAQLVLNANTSAEALANSIITEAHRTAYMDEAWTHYDYTLPTAPGSDFIVSATMNATIDMNFKLEMEDYDATNYFVVKKDGVVLSENQYQKGTLVDSNANGKTRYCVRVPLYANEMCCQIEVEMYDAQGNLLTERTTSVQEYAKTILVKYPTYTSSCRAAVALLDYGSAAQQVVNASTNPADLANSPVTAEERTRYLVWP